MLNFGKNGNIHMTLDLNFLVVLDFLTLLIYYACIKTWLKFNLYLVNILTQVVLKYDLEWIAYIIVY